MSARQPFRAAILISLFVVVGTGLGGAGPADGPARPLPLLGAAATAAVTAHA